jgi:hypothetical protein
LFNIPTTKLRRKMTRRTHHLGLLLRGWNLEANDYHVYCFIDEDCLWQAQNKRRKILMHAPATMPQPYYSVSVS